jgi:hypothetical protein
MVGAQCPSAGGEHGAELGLGPVGRPLLSQQVSQAVPSAEGVRVLAT